MSHGLNAPQREAVHYLDGPLLVLAGAGSGKTRVITQKIAYMIEGCGYPASKITAITFTNKAAKEMKERADSLLKDGSAKGLSVSTFHSLGNRFLRQEARHLGLKPGFSILDASDTFSLFQDLMGNADKGHVRMVQNCISLWKNALLGPEEAAKVAADDFEQAAAATYTEYEKTLRAYQAVDFDDLIRLPVNLLETHEEVLTRWQSRMWHLLVDEYQDTNRCQYRLMRLLAGPKACFTAVGDDDQSIYAWRGADIGNIHLLQEDFPHLKVIKLEQNYRSTTRILQAANAVIAHNPKVFEKKLWSDHGFGDPIHIQFCRDDNHESEWVAAKLLSHKFQNGGKWSDYAILYRGNHQARAIEQQMRQNKVPYLISGGQSFFEKAEIKDILSYLRLIANSDDDPAFIRAITTPKRGIGGVTLEALGRHAGNRHVSLFTAAMEVGIEQHLSEKQMLAVREFCRFISRMEDRANREPARQVLEDLLRAISYESWLFESLDTREAEGKWANVRDFVEWLSRKGDADEKNLMELTQTVALISMLEKGDKEADAVQLATLHASKGLEFRHVFLVGVEEGILPHRDSLEPGKLEEERRLMYVGITRARMSLHVSHCKKRKTGREWRECEPSRFIEEMGDDLKRVGGQDETPPGVEEKAAGRARFAQFKAMLNKPTG
ncbi:MAG TPA: UvrD-helicase domain-containing protein [Rhodocyclaceae bacterium]|nr:UvrD-helicase domain-containing protein [Rhodocyclaceae bacterium]